MGSIVSNVMVSDQLNSKRRFSIIVTIVLIVKSNYSNLTLIQLTILCSVHIHNVNDDEYNHILSTNYAASSAFSAHMLIGKARKLIFVFCSFHIFSPAFFHLFFQSKMINHAESGKDCRQRCVIDFPAQWLVR